MATDSRERFEGVVREHSGRVLAALIGRFRDFQLAEDSLQDAWLLAAERWPVDGWPDRPEGWVYTVAHRRALDVIRRERSRAQRQHAADEQQECESHYSHSTSPRPFCFGHTLHTEFPACNASPS